MKVAHLTTTDISLRYLVFPQLVEVVKDGNQAIGISGTGPFVKDLTDAGVEHRALKSSTRAPNLLADVRAARELWHILREEQPDVLHTHNPKPGVYGRIIGRLAGVPTVVNTVHGLYATTDDRWLKRFVVYLLEAIASRFSHAELIQNPEDLELMHRLRILPRGKGKLLGNGVDLNRFRPGRIDAMTRKQIRDELGIEDRQIVIGVVGRLVREKGFLELFEAARTLGERYVVLAVGPHDPEKPDALSSQQIREAEAFGVRFLGMRADVESLYGAMDIFILPSHREGFPRAAMEAAASGLPVVATDIRGCRQVVEHEDNGLLVPVRDPVALAGALARLGDSPSTMREMGKRSRAKAEREFDERKVVEMVMDTYAGHAETFRAPSDPDKTS